MSRDARQRDAITPSLFPFLAVLLCTMGALVLILMLIVSGAQASALRMAEQSEQQAEEVESQLQLAQQSFQKQLTASQIELEKKRLALQHLENHIQEILADIEGLQQTAELASSEAASDETDQATEAAAISELERQLLDAKEELKQKLEDPQGDKPIFAIIPYDGPNGTHRRPIYLECVQDGIRLQPEGILIRTVDLEPPYGPGNPLDAALRTIRSAYAPANQAVTSTAYPLLIVRPSGIRSYAMARAAMSGWDDQFGYELVGEELPLVYPTGEPGLAQKIAQALDLARARQAALVMAMPQKYREFAGRDEPLSGGSGTGGGSLTGGGGTNSGPGRGGWSSDGALAAEPLASGSAPLGSSPLGSSPLGGGYLGNDPQGSDSLRGDSLRGDSLRGDSLSGGSLGFGEASPLNLGNAGDSYAAGAGGDPTAMNNASNGTGASDLSSSAPGANGSTSSSTAATGSGSGGVQGNQMSLPLSAPNSGGTSSGNSSASQGATAAGASSTSSSLAGNAANSSMDPAQDPAAMPQLSLNRNFSSESNQSAKPVASSKGRGWAWTQGPPSQTSVSRSIRLRCLADRWIVLADSGSSRQPEVTIPLEGPLEQSAEHLARIVADRVDGWGLALAGGYWKPVLQVEVAAGAQWRFTQLQQLFAGSGLDVVNASSPP